MVHIMNACTFGGLFYLGTGYIENSGPITLFLVREYLAQLVR